MRRAADLTSTYKHKIQKFIHRGSPSENGLEPIKAITIIKTIIIYLAFIYLAYLSLSYYLRLLKLSTIIWQTLSLTNSG